jgi:O-methyltransferase
MNKDHFIERATNEGKDTTKFREYVVVRFEEIHQNVECGHHLPTSYYLAENLLLQQNTEGPAIECGCFKGGMSAKLSVICKEIDKELYLIDSFQGLPCDEPTVFWRGKKGLFKKGEWKGTLPEVTKNIEDFGEISPRLV